MESPTTTQLHAYLTFDGNCEAAINFYQRILGGEADFKRFSEGPTEHLPPGQEDKIMHVRYTFDGCVLLASDSGGHYPVEMGNNFHLSVTLADQTKAKSAFKSLSEGGKVTMDFQEVFWGGSFGSCQDQFGVHWMVSCT